MKKVRLGSEFTLVGNAAGKTETQNKPASLPPAFTCFLVKLRRKVEKHGVYFIDIGALNRAQLLVTSSRKHNSHRGGC